jgi:hypothetical protein
LAISKISSYQEEDEKSENEDYENDNQQEGDRSNAPNYTAITKGLYKEETKKHQNKIQNALFVDKSVSSILKTIKTG